MTKHAPEFVEVADRRREAPPGARCVKVTCTCNSFSKRCPTALDAAREWAAHTLRQKTEAPKPSGLPLRRGRHSIISEPPVGARVVNFTRGGFSATRTTRGWVTSTGRLVSYKDLARWERPVLVELP